jgi:hypothetical protein
MTSKNDRHTITLSLASTCVIMDYAERIQQEVAVGYVKALVARNVVNRG